jgi:XTP/dITP diphosphohydrolase
MSYSSVRKKVVFFVTGNIHKFHEARRVLAEYDISVAMLNIDAVEIQDDSLENIAKTSVLDAARKSSLPVFVEDAGLFVKALNGFPGPYSSYVYRTMGTKGILKLMQNERKRDAYFQSVVAFCNPEESLEPKIFKGEVEGRITYEERGKQGFGFDPIFQPYGRNSRTFAEMTTQEKNKHSHRAQALRKFLKWYCTWGKQFNNSFK